MTESPLEPLVGLGTTIKELAGRWTAYAAFGSFCLYLLGYLALRFHLTAMGVGTDLSVLDERYLFTGARFLVYWASCIPIALVLVAAVVGLGYALYRVLPRRAQEAVQRRWDWLRASPPALNTAGIVLSVILIQMLMRKCFLLVNVLLDPDVLHRESRLLSALLDESSWLMPIFFSALVAGSATVAAIAVMTARAAGPERKLTPSRGLLGVVLAIQLLLLPVNYGYLIVDKALPQVAALGSEALPPGDRAWLVWEGKDGMTFLVRRQGGDRSLVTLPRQKVDRVEIKTYDSWTRLLGSDALAGDADGKN